MGRMGKTWRIDYGLVPESMHSLKGVRRNGCSAVEDFFIFSMTRGTPMRP